MNKQLKKYFYVILVVTFSFCVSCRHINQEVPFLIKNLECSFESEDEEFDYIGVKFVFCNTSEKDISEISVRFTIFENKNGGNPLISSNVINADFQGLVKSGDEKIFEISLDDKIVSLPKSPYYVDYFYVESVVFSDNSIWKDCFGAFAISGGNNE